MSPMSVSVVIPAYNCGRFVAETLDSVLGQTSPAEEVIVVDDGSRDDTRERVKRYRERVRYVYQDNQGVSAARNYGVRLAAGEFVAFLDGDDVWHPSKLELQRRVLADDPDIGLLGTDVFDWPGSFPEREKQDVPINRVPFRDLAVKNQFVTSSVLVRRELLGRAGEFDRSLRGPEDYDLWLRVAQLAPVANLPLPLTGYRSVPGSLGKQAVSMEAGMRRILEKLDERDAWGGDWLLRRQAYAYCDYSCGYMHSEAGELPAAVRNLMRSLARYPLPYGRGVMRIPLARLRLLATLLWRTAPVQRRRQSGDVVPSRGAVCEGADRA